MFDKNYKMVFLGDSLTKTTGSSATEIQRRNLNWTIQEAI